jgi:hypothetical protein
MGATDWMDLCQPGWRLSSGDMTSETFRKMALETPGAVESAHMDHPDFRLNGKIFATLGYPEDDYAMIKLTPEEQADFMKRDPAVFSPCAGAWGERGATQVRLKGAKVGILREALALGAKNVSKKKK